MQIQAITPADAASTSIKGSGEVVASVLGESVPDESLPPVDPDGLDELPPDELEEDEEELSSFSPEMAFCRSS